MIGGANSMGTNLNRMLDRLGYPDLVGDLQGAHLDAMTGNFAGAVRNYQDAFSGLPTNQFQQIMGRMPGPFNVQSPRTGIARSRLVNANTYHSMGGTTTVERRDLAHRRPRFVARSLERAIQNNPAFRARMEGMLGGRIVLDGRADGKITVVKSKPNALPNGVNLNAAMTAANPLAGSLYGSLAKLDGEIMDLVRSAGKKVTQNLMGQQTSGQTDVGKLVGPNAPIEDVLAAFLFTQMRDADKELKSLMNQYEALKKKKKKGGLFGGIKNFFKGVGKKLISGAGAALGGTLGGPLGSRIGGALGGGVGDAVLGGGKKGGGDIDHSRSVLNFKIQQAMNRRKEIHDLISNMLKTMHDMSMTSIRNIR